MVAHSCSEAHPLVLLALDLLKRRVPEEAQVCDALGQKFDGQEVEGTDTGARTAGGQAPVGVVVSRGRGKGGGDSVLNFVPSGTRGIAGGVCKRVSAVRMAAGFRAADEHYTAG